MIKRWTTGIFSRVDWMVSQVENHEALVNNALKNAREATARARVQLGRVQKDGRQLRERVASEKQAAERWRERATAVAREDESRAIECLRRSKRAEQLHRQLQDRLLEHEKSEAQLIKDVRKMEEQLSELIEKRNLMRTRQSRAEAVRNVQGSSGLMEGEIDDIFERWETRVTENEIGADCDPLGDSFDEAFVSREEEDALREELKRLTGEKRDAGGNGG